MKKLLLFITLAAVLMTACSNESTEITKNGVEVKTVSLNFMGDFTVEQLTRSTYVEQIQDIWIFDVMESKLIQTIHNKDLSNSRVDLKYGKHDLYVVISAGKEPNHHISTTTITWETVGDTFWGHTSTEVGTRSENTVNITLDRMVAMINIQSSDNIPNNAKSVNITLSRWYYGINYISGNLAGLVKDYTVKVDGLENDTYFNTGIYEFATKEEEKIDVTLDANEEYSNIKHTKVTDVPLKANTVTTLKGNIFTPTSSYTPGTYGIKFNINDSWMTEGYNITW
jgi:hypothetical protein